MSKKTKLINKEDLRIMNNTQNLSTEIDIRKAKINKLKQEKNIVYAEKFVRSHRLAEARNLKDGEKVRVCGRITFRRIMGKLSFFIIEDAEARLQVSIGRNEINEKDYAFFKTMIDTGDFIGVEGELYTTHTGERTMRTRKFTLLSKAILPLPEKFHGLTNQDQIYRERSMDLVSNSESRHVFLMRSRLISFIRSFLEDNGFIEVETPILQSAVCGASAHPFFTKHNALNKMCNLRIAPEVYLKQVIAGGFDRVFEIAKCFRNEGMDSSHLQEFTMLEWYVSYFNFEDNIKFFTKFLRECIKKFNDGKLTLEFKGHKIDFSKKFARIDYLDKMKEILGFDVLEFTNIEDLKKRLVKTGLFSMEDFEDCISIGKVIDLVYKRKIRNTIIDPTIIYDYPASLVPLARRNDKDPRRIDMFQILVCGDEICKAYSELIDPIVQRKALEEQARARSRGDDEAMELDEDFLVSMEHGMPPMSGLGFGIDRFMCILSGRESVRDVVLFPLMK